jgi:hypothetical protein
MIDPWLLAGDFNDIMCAEEKRGGVAASTRKCNIFKDRIDVCKLMDIGAMGPKFTWRGPLYHGGQRIYERLDRALCNSHWRLLFPDGYVKVLPRMDFSDHHPILISPKEVPHPIAPRQFRFESAWLLEKTYLNMMKQSWNQDNSMSANLNNVEQGIKRWKFQSIDHILYKKKELMARINGVQRTMQVEHNSGRLKRLEQKLQNELNDILHKEELMWFQRSRAKWLIDGDRNTRYYHLKTVNRRKKNNITMLKDSNGNWVEDIDQIRHLVNEYYINLFDESIMSRAWFQTNISFPPLELVTRNTLAAPISDEEVKNAVFKMPPGKRLGRMVSLQVFTKSLGRLLEVLYVILSKRCGGILV